MIPGIQLLPAWLHIPNSQLFMIIADSKVFPIGGKCRSQYLITAIFFATEKHYMFKQHSDKQYLLTQT